MRYGCWYRRRGCVGDVPASTGGEYDHKTERSRQQIEPGRCSALLLACMLWHQFLLFIGRASHPYTTCSLGSIEQIRVARMWPVSDSMPILVQGGNPLFLFLSINVWLVLVKRLAGEGSVPCNRLSHKRYRAH